MTSIEFKLSAADNDRLANLCGPLDEHIRLIEARLGVDVSNRGAAFKLSGPPDANQLAKRLIIKLYQETEKEVLTPEKVHLAIQEVELTLEEGDQDAQEQVIKTRRNLIRCRGGNQSEYVKSIRTQDLTFGIGPAGTGKTYLAVACAVEALEQDMVRRLVLVRPAVEAGEKLGFLPGDLTQKVDPYLRPIYDALYEFLGFEKVAKLIERNVIEVAPLAYMRGRTLNNACIIMDEAQNTTPEQMKMFLTRIGFGSTAIITGDQTQIDLPKHVVSGLRHVQTVLKDVKGVGFTHFEARDVVRHPMVKAIVSAYERAEQDQAKRND